MNVTDKMIKDAINDRLKARIDRNNNGMRATYKESFATAKLLASLNIKVTDNIITRDGVQIYRLRRRYASRKTNGCYRELMPTLECI